MTKSTEKTENSKKEKNLKSKNTDVKNEKLKKFNEMSVKTKNFTRNSFGYYQESLSIL